MCAMKKYTKTGGVNHLLELQQLSFALVDLNLYLDTHPQCQKAIEDFNTLFQKYWESKSNYEAQHGPLTNFGFSPASYPSQWINNPWPWEKAANQ